MVHRYVRGLTLSEVVIVLSILGVILALASTQYIQVLQESRRHGCQAVLLQAANVMERYFIDNHHYRAAALQGEDTGTPRIFPGKCPVNGDEAFYRLTIAQADNRGYMLKAIPLASGSQQNDPCATLTLSGASNHDGGPVKGVEAAARSVRDCWR